MHQPPPAAALLLTLAFLGACDGDDEPGTPRCRPGAGPRFVAVGHEGTAIYTDDPLDCWARGTVPGSPSLRAVATDGDGHWVAVGTDGAVVRSDDGGETWTEADSGTTQDLFGVATDGAGTWMAAGTVDTVLVSTDRGDSWTAVDPGTNVSFNAIASDGGSRWVAVGAMGGAFSEDDGATWTDLVNFPPRSMVMFDVAWGDGTWRSVGSWPYIDWSTDGMVWNEQYTGFFGGYGAVAYHPDGEPQWLVAEGRGALLERRWDGEWIAVFSETTDPWWTTAEHPAMQDLVWGDGRWVGVGDAGCVLVQTDQGSGWRGFEQVVDGQTLFGVAHTDFDPGTGSTGPICLFCETFEDGDWLGWADGGGGYTISVVPTATLPTGAVPEGQWSLSLTGGLDPDRQAPNGIWAPLPGLRPEVVSWVARADRFDQAVANVRLAGSGGELAEVAFRQVDGSTDGGLRVNGDTWATVPAGTWAEVTLTDIDWVARTFDVLLDGVEVADEVPFLAPATDLDRLDLYNEGDTQSWFDELRLTD